MPTRVVLVVLAAATLLNGCGGGSGNDPTPTSTPTTTASTPTDSPVTDAPPPMDGPLRTEQTGQPAPEPPGPERPDSPRPGEVTVSLPSLPIGGSEVFNAADGTGCVEASYLGGDKHPIPDGAGITVTAISFSSDILKVGGSGCSGRSTCQSREVAFTADARGCVVPVLITREPTPGRGRDVTMTMKGVVRCSSGQQQVCQEFADSLVADLDQGGLDTAVSIEILGSETTSEPEPTTESSPGTESTTPTTDSSAETTDTGTSLG